LKNRQKEVILVFERIKRLENQIFITRDKIDTTLKEAITACGFIPIIKNEVLLVSI